MPDFARKLSAQPVSQCPKPRWEHLLDVVVCKHPSAFAFLVTVNARAQRLGRHALVYGMIRRDNCRDCKRLLRAMCFCC